MARQAVVVDASAMVDLLVGSPASGRVRSRLEGCALHAPAHFDAEVLSALGRLHRAGKLHETEVAERLALVAAAPVRRHEVPSLLAGAWSRRHNLRLVDALYAELASQLGTPLVTTDGGLAAAFPLAELANQG